MEETKEVLKVVNAKDTLVKTLEGDAKVEYQYAGEDYTTVMEQPIEKGVVKSVDGEFPQPDPGKTLEKQKVSITVNNNPFYRNRSFLFDTQLKQKLIGKGQKFPLKEEKMTKEQKQEYRDQLKSQRLANAIERFGS